MFLFLLFFFFNDTATTEIYTLSLHDALPICRGALRHAAQPTRNRGRGEAAPTDRKSTRLNSSHVAISYAVFCLKKKQACRETGCLDAACAAVRLPGGVPCRQQALGEALIAPVFFFNDTATTEIYTLSLHDALPISRARRPLPARKVSLGQSGFVCE